MGVSRRCCLCLLSGARWPWLGHACHSPTVKPGLCYHRIPGLTQRTARSAWNPCGSSVPDMGPAVGTSLSMSHVPVWLEHPAPPALIIFFREFIACLGFRKHLHRARLGSQRSDFHPFPLAGQVPPCLAFRGTILGLGFWAGVCSRGVRWNVQRSSMLHGVISGTWPEESSGQAFTALGF